MPVDAMRSDELEEEESLSDQLLDDDDDEGDNRVFKDHVASTSSKRLVT